MKLKSNKISVLTLLLIMFASNVFALKITGYIPDPNSQQEYIMIMPDEVAAYKEHEKEKEKIAPYIAIGFLLIFFL